MGRYCNEFCKISAPIRIPQSLMSSHEGPPARFEPLKDMHLDLAEGRSGPFAPLQSRP